MHYLTDPCWGVRVPIGAVVQQDGRTAVVRNTQTRLTGAEARTAALILDDLEAEPAFNALPVGCGPLAVWTEPFDIPADLAEPAAWLLDTLNRR